MSHSQEVAHKKLSSSLGFSDDTELDLPMLALNAAARVDRLSAELAAANGRIRELEQINSSLVDKANSYIVESGKLANQLTAEREVSDKLGVALGLMLEVIAPPPDSNCSCHISPPCNDCIEHGGAREAFTNVHAILAEVKALRAGKTKEVRP